VLVTVDLEVTVEGVGAGTHSKSWRERIPDCKRCHGETMSIKQSADIWGGEQNDI